jgi:two-component system, chemotaxis family, chemotaxis protein CheY
MAVETLIVDDSPVARRIIHHHLEQIGCKVVGEAGNAALGVRFFRELKPDIVTLDLIMPAVEGIDAIAAFRIMKKENPKAEIMVVSAVAFEQTRRTMSGAMAYIIKPFNKFSFEQARTRLVRAFPELETR